MNLESDSDLQEYLNQLIKKAHEFKHDETSSDGISPPSNLSLESEENVPKESSNPKPIPIKSVIKNAAKSKLSAIEQKYLKKAGQPKDEAPSYQRKQSLANLSNQQIEVSSDESEPGSRSRPESRSDRYRTESSKVSTVRTDEILNLDNVLSFNDLVNMAGKKETNNGVGEVEAGDANGAANQQKDDIRDRDTSVSSILERPSQLDDEEEGNRNIFHASQKTELQRQSSTSSLLLPREGVFYSTSADRTKRKNSVLVFKDEVVWARVSTEGSNNTTDSRTSQAESIEEDIASPEVKPKVKKDSKDSLLNVAPEKRNRGSSKQQIQNQRDNERVREEPRDKTADKGVKHSVKHKTNTKFSNGRSLKMKKPLDPPKQRPSLKSRSRNHSSHSSSSSLSSSSEKRDHKNDRTTTSSSSSEVIVKERSRSRRYESLFSSSSSSSSASIVSLKTRHKHSSKKKKKKKRKTKLKNEHLLVELITKTMIKVLPKLHPNLYHENVRYSHPVSTMLVNPGLSYMPMELKANNITTSNAATYVPASITTARIDDALKQTVAITREFLEAHQMLYNAYLKVLSTDSKYASAEKIEEILRNGSQFQTLNSTFGLRNEIKKEKEKLKNIYAKLAGS